MRAHRLSVSETGCVSGYGAPFVRVIKLDHVDGFCGRGILCDELQPLGESVRHEVDRESFRNSRNESSLKEAEIPMT